MLPFFGSRPGGRKLYYNLDLPSFQRDFASLKTLDHGTGPAITFTRASDATYFDADGTLQTATNDTPRFDHDPATGASRGLLIEEARTNLLTKSSEADHADWGVKTNITISSNAEASPDGTTTADKIEASGATGGYILAQTKTLATSTAYTGSVFLKAGDISHCFVGLAGTAFADSFASVNLSDGSMSSASGTPTSFSSQAIGNGWYRVSVVLTSSSAASGGLSVYLSNDGVWANRNDAIAAGEGIYIWGAQLEQGAFATSYIPTTTAAATRSADSAVVTPISGFYNQAEGTLFAEFATTASGNRVAVSIDDSSNDNRVQVGAGSGNVNQPITGIAAQGVSQFFLTYANISSQPFRIIMALRANDSQTVVNSTAQTAVTSLTMPSPNRMAIGTDRLDSAYTNGHIRKIAYYPKRLTNTLLEQLTT